MTQTLQLRIDGMHCAACVRRVTMALTKLKGVQLQNVEVGSAQLTFDPRTVSVPQITAAVGEIGFTATAEMAVH